MCVSPPLHPLVVTVNLMLFQFQLAANPITLLKETIKLSLVLGAMIAHSVSNDVYAKHTLAEPSARFRQYNPEVSMATRLKFHINEETPLT